MSGGVKFGTVARLSQTVWFPHFCGVAPGTRHRCEWKSGDSRLLEDTFVSRWAVNTGILGGKSGNELNPQADSIRAKRIAMLTWFYELGK